MCSVNGTIQYVSCEWDYQMCHGKELANVPWEWDYPMCHVNGISQCAQGKGISNVHWDWD